MPDENEVAPLQPSDQTADPSIDSYSEFIRMGDTETDAPTEAATTAATAAAPNSGATTATTAAAVAPAPVTSNYEIRSPRPSQQRQSSPSSASPPQQNGSHSGEPQNASTFFTSFFRKATNTIETSLQAAQLNSSEALSTAQQHVSAASSSAISTVTGLVLDIGTSFNHQQRDAASSNVHPPVTAALKSLRLPPPAMPLLLFHAPIPIIVSQSALHMFTAESPRPTAVPLNIVQTTASATTLAAPPHNPVVATLAALMAGPRVAIAHDDGAIVVFSLSSSNLAAFDSATPPHPSPTTALTALLPAGLAVARRDGSVHLLNANLQPLVSLPPPDMCAGALTPALTSAAATSLAAVAASTRLPSALLVAYDDGTVCAWTAAGVAAGAPFVAHVGAPGAVAALFDAALILTVGNDADRSIAVFDRVSGRCLARRSLPFAPTCLSPIVGAPGAVSSEMCGVCPSPCSFLVGGDEAQVEAFRIVALSPRKVDIKLVLRVGERQRGRKRGVVQALYKRDTGVLTAVCENGDVRRWELCRADAASLCMLEEERGLAALFTERNIVEKMDTENERVEDARLNCASGVLRAQGILAAILDDESVPEDKKDELVIRFQVRQAEMLKTLTDADKEVRRARRRMFGRFSAGVKAFSEGVSSDLERTLGKETRRAAAFEAEYVTRRYREKIEQIKQETVEKLKEIVKDFIKGLGRTNSLIVEQASRDIDMLGTEEAEVEVD